MKTGTKRDLLILTTEKVSQDRQEALRSMGAKVFQVEIIKAQNLKRANSSWIDTWTKFHIWEMTEYSKVVFMDSDMFVRNNIDSLFAYPEVSAVRDVILSFHGERLFNSGLFVLKPSLETHRMIFDFIERFPKDHKFSYPGDQGILNDFFKDKWFELPSTFNFAKSFDLPYCDNYVHKHIYNQNFISVVHYNVNKPWRPYADKEKVKEWLDCYESLPGEIKKF